MGDVLEQDPFGGLLGGEGGRDRPGRREEGPGPPAPHAAARPTTPNCTRCSARWPRRSVWSCWKSWLSSHAALCFAGRQRSSSPLAGRAWTRSSRMPRQQFFDWTVTWVMGKPAVTRPQVAEDLPVGRALLQDGVGREGVHAGGQRPHVEVVHRLDARHALHRRSQRGDVHLARGALEQHVQRLAQERPRARQHEEGDRHGHQRVHAVEAGGAHHQRAHDHADRRERVGHDLVVGAAQVEAGLGSRPQQERPRHVDQQSDARDQQHRAARDGPRIAEALPRLDQDVARHAQQQHPVRERREHLRPVVAEGAARRRRPLGELHRQQRQHRGRPRRSACGRRRPAAPGCRSRSRRPPRPPGTPA